MLAVISFQYQTHTWRVLLPNLKNTAEMEESSVGIGKSVHILYSCFGIVREDDGQDSFNKTLDAFVFMTLTLQLL